MVAFVAHCITSGEYADALEAYSKFGVMNSLQAVEQLMEVARQILVKYETAHVTKLLSVIQSAKFTPQNAETLQFITLRHV